MWFTSPNEKVFKTSTGRKSSYTVYLAKNEYEGCQAALRYKEDKTVTVEILPESGEAFPKGVSAEIFTENYISTTYGEYFVKDTEKVGKTVEYPDGLIPYSGGEIKCEKDTTTPLYVRFHTDKTAEAGEYKFSLNVKCGEDTVSSGTVTLHVWNFEMPDGRQTQTAVCLFKSYVKKVTGKEGGELTEEYRKYYDFLLEYNISSYDLPYDILDERADKYMSDPRVTTFRVPYSDDDGKIKAYYEKLSQNEEWMKKAYFYPLDEPKTPDAFVKVNKAGARLRELFPGYRMCVPFFVNTEIFPGEDAISYISEYMNVWCPKLFFFTDDVTNRLKAEREGGDDVWWYVCWEPGEPYCNLYVNESGLHHREIFWQSYLYGVNGFLYWGANYWRQVDNPWIDISTVKDLNENCYGDGTLLYPGNFVGIDGPCPSLRIEAVRDGIDDVEYMKMAEALGISNEKIQKQVSSVTKSVTEYTEDENKLNKARIAIGNLIEKATAN